MAVELDQFRHQAWQTVVGMGIGYLILLVGVTVALFLVPYLVFMAL